MPELGIQPDEHELDDAALEALAEAYAEPPPARLRERILAAVARDREREGAARRLRRTRLVGALAAGIALVLGGLLARELRRDRARDAELAGIAYQNGVLSSRVDGQARTLGARIEEQGRALAKLDESVATQAQIIRLVGGPRILTANLAPQKGVVGAGRVLVDAATGEAAVVLSGLAAPGADKAYELWAIRGKRPPEPAGIVALSDTPAPAIRVPAVPRPGEVTAFAVSIEPRGGSTSPTGPIVLVGTLG